MIHLLTAYWPALLNGLRVTALLALLASGFGLGLGIIVGVAVRGSTIAVRALRLLVVVISAIPVLVLLTWLHYPAQSVFHVVIDPFLTTLATLLLVNTILVADAVSRTVDQLPAEWTLMARMSGLTPGQTALRVTLPLAARQLVGPLVFIQVGILQATLFGSLISVDELFRTIQQINAREYQPVELYTLLALFFLVACAPLQIVAAAANRRFAQDLSLR